MRGTIRTVAIGVAGIAGIALLPMQQSSAAAAKVGQKCTKVGQKSGALVCTKVGTKLTYQRPAATPAPTVTAAPVTTAASGTPTTAATAAAAPLPNATNLQKDPANVKKGGTLNYMAGELLSLDPSRYPGGGTAGFTHGSAIFDTLLRLNKDGTFGPQMAAGISTADSGKTWILKMRSNTKFTDGTPYDAAAVQFNFNRYLDPKTAFPMVNQVSDIDRTAGDRPPDARDHAEEGKRLVAHRADRQRRLDRARRRPSRPIPSGSGRSRSGQGR